MKLTVIKRVAAMISVVGLAVGLAADADAASGKSTVVQKLYGKLADGTEVTQFTLTNATGAEAQIITYGGIVTSLKMPDRNGKLGDIVLGYDTLDGYLKESPYFGALIGRYGNRIGKGTFTLNGKTYQLANNDNKINHLHGGTKGFDKVVWTAKVVGSKRGPAIELTYVSKDGDEGYPGTLTVKAVYTLTNKNELRLDYTATTDKDTVCNLTQHNYYNLACDGDILGHQLMIKSDCITPVDAGLIATGKLRPVDGTPFDFRKPTAIGGRVNAADEQLKFGGGYDHNWVIKKPFFSKLALMARVVEPVSGRTMDVLSTEPALQFYCGNFLDGHLIGKGGKAYQHRTGFCLEPQHSPDSPNRPEFPSVVLKPGQTYTNTIIYRFGVQK